MSLPRTKVLLLACGAFVLVAMGAHAQQNEIHVGHISSTTNPASNDNARNLSFGYQLYFDFINANGGLNGRKLRLVHRDDNLNAGRMVEITRELIADPGIIALVGFLNTAGLTEIARQDILGKSGIAMISPLQGNREIVSAENMFPFRSGYEVELRALIEEAKTTHKQRLAIVFMNIAFGPSQARYAEQVAKEFGLGIATYLGYEVAPDKSEASIREAIVEVEKSRADAVLLVAAGRGAFDFIKGLRATPVATIQIYGMSVLQANDLIKFSGLEAAKGVIISQAVPYPFSGVLPVTREFLRLMQARAQTDQAINFQTFEGFLGAKITVEALRRAGPVPTRRKVIDAPKGMGEFDLGGVSVEYTPTVRNGWRGVDMTIIGSGGRLFK
ncbi:MAG: ABC transporter substrate-binding protein [Burkholderiales bacterium]